MPPGHNRIRNGADTSTDRFAQPTTPQTHQPGRNSHQRQPPTHLSYQCQLNTTQSSGLFAFKNPKCPSAKLVGFVSLDGANAADMVDATSTFRRSQWIPEVAAPRSLLAGWLVKAL